MKLGILTPADPRMAKRFQLRNSGEQALPGRPCSSATGVRSQTARASRFADNGLAQGFCDVFIYLGARTIDQNAFALS